MSASERVTSPSRGGPLSAVIAVFWLGLGFSALGDGRTWYGVAAVVLSLAFGSTYLWPRSAFTRFVEKPVLGRRHSADG
jgi:hypothetical protein